VAAGEGHAGADATDPTAEAGAGAAATDPTAVAAATDPIVVGDAMDLIAEGGATDPTAGLRAAGTSGVSPCLCHVMHASSFGNGIYVT
jgi:hypothetical protein